ncbi:MAG: hypothetical protein LBR73_07545 [Oscillospiraceae bacterium]|jgi:predicted HTH transcriptional regulator|nr:hypothetical protein [Oscillospiraceae bacterium]
MTIKIKVNLNILTDRNVQTFTVEGKSVIMIDVPRADRRDKPIFIAPDPFKGAYRRNGEGDYHCTQNDVRGMFRDQSDLTQDMRILTQLDLDAFDYDTVHRYRNNLRNIRAGHVWENLPDVDFLHKLGAIGRSEEGRLHPTAAGALMFGYEYEIVKEFASYFLDYQEHMDDSTRWTDRVVSNLSEWSGNLYDFFYRVYNRIVADIKTPFKLEGITRIDDTKVHQAIREALVNALLHSSFYERRGLVIHKRPQEITIANPGGLRISQSDAIFGMSDPRNSTLVKFFALINIGERAGSGIPGIWAVWEEQGWPTPILEEKFSPDRTILTLKMPVYDGFHATDPVQNENIAGTENDTANGTPTEISVPNSDENGTVNSVAEPCEAEDGTASDNEKQEAILKALKQDPRLTIDALEKMLPFSRRTIVRHTQVMQKDGRLRREGASKDGRWVVT